MVKRVFPLLFLAGLLAVVILKGAATDHTLSASTLETHGFAFEEVSQEAGITFLHQAPVLDPKLDHIMPQVASMGAAVSVTDFDADGWPDLYTTNSGAGSANALFRNNGDGTFSDVAAAVGLADLNEPETGASMGSIWGDADNDGFEDVFLYRWGRQDLYLNQGGSAFRRVDAGLPEWANVNAATWLDYDRDGVLDLFFGGYYAEGINLWDLSDTRIMPESFEYAQNGGRKYLYRGLGDGTFEDQSALLGPETHRWMMAVAAADLRGTGYPDLFIANDYGVDELYFNQNGEGFLPAGESARIGFSPKSGMNVAFGDIHNQGQMAVYVTNISEPGILLQGNNLWVPLPGPSPDALSYTNLAATLGVERGDWSYGAQFGDVNNDGALDLFLTNGYVSASKEADYWYDFSKVAGGNRAIIGDAANWPAMQGRSLSGYQRKRLWLGDGRGQFREVGLSAGITETFDGRAVAMVDLWNRGVLDVVVAHQRGPLLVYRNMAQAADNWIAISLVGTQSNRSAIGARVEVYWNGRRQVQEVLGASGFAAQNQRSLHFGLGPGARADSVAVRWPSGSVQVLASPAVGRFHTIQEPQEEAITPSPVTIAGR